MVMDLNHMIIGPDSILKTRGPELKQKNVEKKVQTPKGKVVSSSSSQFFYSMVTVNFHLAPTMTVNSGGASTRDRAPSLGAGSAPAFNYLQQRIWITPKF